MQPDGKSSTGNTILCTADFGLRQTSWCVKDYCARNNRKVETCANRTRAETEQKGD